MQGQQKSNGPGPRVPADRAVERAPERATDRAGGRSQTDDRADGPALAQDPLSPLGILALQRAIGNRAVTDLIQRAQAGGESVRKVLGSSGRPMDQSLRTEMEMRLGHDFSRVRVHDDAAAAESAEQVGARAYTSGSHVVLGPGGADKHTIAHELTHVIQQSTGPVAGSDHGGGLAVSDPEDRFERAAEANAARAMAAPLGPPALPAPPAPLQRAVDAGSGVGVGVGVQVTVSGAEPAPNQRSISLVTPTTPVIQRLTHFAVQIGMSPGPLVAPPPSSSPPPRLGAVTRVNITGRPHPNPFSGGEGSHTTAWETYCDGVRRRIAGLDVDAAIAQMGVLLQDTIELAPAIAPAMAHPAGPATGLTARYDAHANQLEGDRRTNFVAAVQSAQTALATARPGSLSDLQEIIVTYLSARNLAPFAAVFLGEAKAKGGGEVEPLRVLRLFETGQLALVLDTVPDPKATEVRPTDLKQALWTLLDSKTMLFAESDPGAQALYGDPNSTQVPGFHTGDPGHAVNSILARHLHQMSVSYPRSYQAAQIGAAVGAHATDIGLANRDRSAIPVPAVTGAPAAAAPGWSRTDQADMPFAVQLVLTPSTTPSGSVVGDVRMDGRHGTLRGSEQGHHLTSHGAILRAVANALRGNDVLVARDALTALARETAAIATMPVAMDNAWDPAGYLKRARETADNAFATAADDNLLLQNPAGVLQEAASSYCGLRNALPLAAVFHGSNANSHGEPIALYHLDLDENPLLEATLPKPASVKAEYDAKQSRYNQAVANGDHPAPPGLRGARTPAAVRASMWDLLDTGVLTALWSGDVDEDDMPGAADWQPLDRMSAILAVHLATMERAWPVTTAAVNIRSATSLSEMLDSLTIVVSDEEKERLKTDLRLTGDFSSGSGSGSHSRKGMSKRKKANSEDEFSEGEESTGSHTKKQSKTTKKPTGIGKSKGKSSKKDGE